MRQYFNNTILIVNNKAKYQILADHGCKLVSLYDGNLEEELAKAEHVLILSELDMEGSMDVLGGYKFLATCLELNHYWNFDVTIISRRRLPPSQDARLKALSDIVPYIQLNAQPEYWVNILLTACKNSRYCKPLYSIKEKYDDALQTDIKQGRLVRMFLFFAKKAAIF